MTDFKISRRRKAIQARRAENALCRSQFNASSPRGVKHGRQARAPR